MGQVVATLIQRSFSTGEISPSLYARNDLAKYVTALRTFRNFWSSKKGTADNRPGTSFICEVKDSTKEIRLIPFIFNDSQTYIIEAGDMYMRFIKNSQQVLESALTITGITNANPAVVTITGHGYSNGDEVYISGVEGMSGINTLNFKVNNSAPNTFELQTLDGVDFDSTLIGSYISGGTASRVYEIATPYLEADLATLQYVQSADVITIVHPNYEPRELSRTGDTSWSLDVITFAPDQVPPVITGVTGTAGPTAFTYHVTAVNDETGEESLADTFTTGLLLPPDSSQHTISYTPAAGASAHNIYLEENGIAGFVAVSGASPYINDGLVPPDLSDTPPQSRNPFLGVGNYPSTVTFFQQRRMFANSNEKPETVWGSRTGFFDNFTVSKPTQDDDAVTFTMAGRQVNQVKHLLDIRKLIVLTTGGEHTVGGDSDGVLKPTGINLQQQSYNGANDLSPIAIGGSALYVQARGSVVRDLGFDFQVDGYRGNDLTILSSHIFDGFTIKDWAYQKIPNSIVWTVRSDGALAGLTYIREQEVISWHRHDFTNGFAENVAAIPGSEVDDPAEDFLYITVKRVIDGRTVRYIEKLNTRQVDADNIAASIFTDSTLSYDGTNTNDSLTMTLSGGTSWDYNETLTLTSSSPYFSSADVGNAIHITGSDGTLIRFSINAFTSSTVITGRAQKTIPVSMRGIAISSWAKAVTTLSGLNHLEGQGVSVFGDGFVVANPNNNAYVGITVSNGSITLDRPYAIVHVGLPITSDIETLDIDQPNGQSMIDKKKLASTVSVYVEKSRGLWVGAEPPPDESTDFLGGLYELKIRDDEGYEEPVRLLTDSTIIPIKPQWNNNGRVFIRQTDPVPLTILAIAPEGDFPLPGK